MSRSSIFIVLGVLILLVPFSGFPIALRTLLIVVFGGAVIGIGVVMRSEETARREPPTLSQSEPEPPPESPQISAI